jgi:hypothetical protein
MNRLTPAIERTRTKVEALDIATRKSLDENLDLDFEEHFQYQETQARAHVMEKLSADEAQVIYSALGEVGSSTNGGWARDTDLATKIIVTQIIGELLQMRINAVR